MHNLLRYKTSDLFVPLVCDGGHRRLKHSRVKSLRPGPGLTFCLSPGPRIISDMMSMGTGNTMVELFSCEMLFRVCRYRS